MAADSKAETLEALEKRQEELEKIKSYNDAVRDGVEHILNTAPSPDAEKDTDRKVRLLLLRAKARMLLPITSSDTEKDLHAVLKLRHEHVEAWVGLAESFLRRKAFKEAADALENALRISPNHVGALCKYSQVQRHRCGDPAITAEQRTAYLNDSIAKAHAAVRVDMMDGEAWRTLSLALLSQATSDGMTYAGAKKALAAMQQAEQKDQTDPDTYFNKAMLESLTGNFGAAVADFARAHELDNTRLAGTKEMCESNYTVLSRAAMRQKNATGIGKRDFQKTMGNLTTAIAAAKKAGPPMANLTHLAVVDIVTDARMQPQVLLTADEHEAFSFVLLYGVSGKHFKIGDVVSFPLSKAKRVEVAHHVAANPEMGLATELSLTLPHFYADANAMLVNQQRVPSQSRLPLQLSSRLFK